MDTQTGIHSDFIMWGVLRTLHADLSGHMLNPPAFPGELSLEHLREVREWGVPRYASPYSYKVAAQLSTWLKRYCFSQDVYSDDDRLTLTVDKFLTDGKRIGLHTIKPIMFPFLQKVRRRMKEILGVFDEEFIIEYGRFSRKATAGFSGKNVYLDEKIHPGSCITGTKAEIDWFQLLINDYPILRDSVSGCSYTTVSRLDQIHVAKSYKALRGVKPNTLIGSFRSYGIGRLISKRLADFGLSIKYGQSRHMSLAKTASRRLHLVTADLSSASDSITGQLLNIVLPRKWYNGVKFGRTPYIRLENKDYYSPSFMAMGIGFTFELMTTLFLSILLEIQDATSIRGTISVFGDDLIYPTRMHPYVEKIFTALGFVFNSDKTFVKSCFRESCGGDYYDGFDVRPSSPRGMSELLKGNSLCAYVYKLFNSLIRRWEEEEIPLTCQFLTSLIVGEKSGGFVVPPHFPDESGFKRSNWKDYLRSDFSLNSNVKPNLRKPDYHGSSFPCLVDVEKIRKVRHQGIYYLEKLVDHPQLIEDYKNFSDKVDFNAAPWEILLWKLVKTDARIGAKHKAYRKWVAFTTRKGNFGYIQGIGRSS